MGMEKVSDFIRRLYQLKEGEDGTDPAEQALREGWVSAEDVYNAERSLDRQTAARIVHGYIRIVQGAEDLPDITAASFLRDLYDCRLCVNHIAQVCLRGIMDARKIPGISDRGFFIFDHRAEVSEEEAEEIISRL